MAIVTVIFCPSPLKANGKLPIAKTSVVPGKGVVAVRVSGFKIESDQFAPVPDKKISLA